MIKDNYNGYQYLVRIFNQLQQPYTTKTFHIGLEATSDCWKNIYYFLKKQSEAFVLTVLNPIQTKAFARTELRRASTDPVAAKDIARFMVEKQPPLTERRFLIVSKIWTDRSMQSKNSKP